MLPKWAKISKVFQRFLISKHLIQNQLSSNLVQLKSMYVLNVRKRRNINCYQTSGFTRFGAKIWPTSVISSSF